MPASEDSRGDTVGNPVITYEVIAMTLRLSFYSLLMASTASTALLVVSLPSWSADHRDAPLIRHVSGRDVIRCPTVLGLPMRVTMNVPAAVLGKANIAVDHYTRSENGTVDASDYIVWRQPMGSTLSTIVNPGDKPGNSQVNEGFLTLPSLGGRPYMVKFHFESLTSGKSCDLATHVEYGLPQPVVVYWSSGAVRKTE